MIHDVEDLTGRTVSFIYSPAVFLRSSFSLIYHINRFCKFYEFSLKFFSIIFTSMHFKNAWMFKKSSTKSVASEGTTKNTL